MKQNKLLPGIYHPISFEALFTLVLHSQCVGRMSLVRSGKKAKVQTFFLVLSAAKKNLLIHSKGKRIMELKKQGWRRKEENNYLRWNWLLSHTKIKGLEGNGTFSTSFSLRSSVDNFSLASVCVFCAIEWQTIFHPLWAPAVVVAPPEESLVRSLSRYDL